MDALAVLSTQVSNAGHRQPSGARHASPLRVALVNMPFASSRRPSVQLGLLQAILSGRGIPAKSIYFNLAFGEFLGWEKYESLCHARDILLGEWLFARAAFGADAPDSRPYLEHHVHVLNALCAELACDNGYLVELRERVIPRFIGDCIERTDWSGFDVVGFSSIFEQNCAALALARRLKRDIPRIFVIFGGANFEDEMGLEYLRALDWIDYAVIGEGDDAFPALLECLAHGLPHRFHIAKWIA